jgi:hypothetical protein
MPAATQIALTQMTMNGARAGQDADRHWSSPRLEPGDCPSEVPERAAAQAAASGMALAPGRGRALCRDDADQLRRPHDDPAHLLVT